jgi:hypothetical protein
MTFFVLLDLGLEKLVPGEVGIGEVELHGDNIKTTYMNKGTSSCLTISALSDEEASEACDDECDDSVLQGRDHDLMGRTHKQGIRSSYHACTDVCTPRCAPSSAVVHTMRSKKEYVSAYSHMNTIEVKERIDPRRPGW